MNTRDLKEKETEKTTILDRLDITYALLFLTKIGLEKSILDATKPIVQLLKNELIHDYGSQLTGAEHKIILPCIIFTKNELVETKISLYRPSTKEGDPRMWPGKLHKYASPDQAFALFIANSNIVLLNLSDGQPLDVTDDSNFSEILASIDLEKNKFSVINRHMEETSVEEADSTEIDEPSRFEVSSYGWDSDVEGLVKRMNRKDIKLPGFQRGFVWSQTEQSRFIESLILGLPVPNIFLAKDSDSKTLNIIDGQQRLKTLQRYLTEGFPISNSKKIHEDLRGCYFNKDVAKSEKSKVLEDADARTLSDSILHSIVISPDPSSDSAEYGYEYNNAVIQIFRRLNTSGKALQPQEVRSCIFYGPFDDHLHNVMNKEVSWRSLFGVEHSRYKDVETILRFLALYENHATYKAPMPSFLDRYMEEKRNLDTVSLQNLNEVFKITTTRLIEACGESLFKKGGTFLLSKFDAITVGLAKSIDLGVTLNDSDINAKVAQLLDDPIYKKATAEFINDTQNVTNRIDTAIKIFKG